MPTLTPNIKYKKAITVYKRNIKSLILYELAKMPMLIVFLDKAA